MITSNPQSTETFSDRFSTVLLLPGEAVCEALNVRDRDSRMLLRMFVNVSLYAKLAMLAVYFLA